MEILKRISLPLLEKEMVELAARSRTYVIRMAYAVFLLLICWIVMRIWIPWNFKSVLDVLGSGRIVLNSLDTLQNLGLQFVLPTLACGAFTIEKERNTLGLLLLTRLRPWTIICEKLLSRLLLSSTFLIIALPLLGFGYALGGITLDQVLAKILAWLVTSIVIICASLLCSAYFRTTSNALLGTYLLVLLTRLGFLWVFEGILGNVPYYMVLLFLIPGMSSLVGGATLAPTGGGQLMAAAAISIPWLLTSGVYLLLTRWFLVRRAFLAPRRSVQVVFDALYCVNINVEDVFRPRMWKSRMSEIVRERNQRTLPESGPVAWRERSKLGLGLWRNVLMILMLLDFPILLYLCHLYASYGPSSIYQFALGVQITFWLIMVTVISVHCAGLIPRERGTQNLDVLLATPMSGREIVDEKMSGIWGLIWILESPMWLCLLFRWQAGLDLPQVIGHAALLLIYPNSLAWSCMWYGLNSRTAHAAVTKSLMMLMWKTVGILIVGAVTMMGIVSITSWEFSQELENIAWIPSHISPLPLFIHSEFTNIAQSAQQLWSLRPINAAIIFSVIQLSLLALNRSRCLYLADIVFKRAPEPKSFATFNRNWHRYLADYISARLDKAAGTAGKHEGDA